MTNGEILDILKKVESSDGKDVGRDSKDTVGSYHVKYSQLSPEYKKIYKDQDSYEAAIVTKLPDGTYTQSPEQEAIERKIADSYLTHESRYAGLSELPDHERGAILLTLYNTGVKQMPKMMAAISTYGKLIKNNASEQMINAARMGVVAQMDVTTTDKEFSKGVMKRTNASRNMFLGEDYFKDNVMLEQMSNVEATQWKHNNFDVMTREARRAYATSGFNYSDNSTIIDMAMPVVETGTTEEDPYSEYEYEAGLIGRREEEPSQAPEFDNTNPMPTMPMDDIVRESRKGFNQ